MDTESLAIVVPGATAVLLAAVNVGYQRWLTNKTLGQQAELTQRTLDHERSIARDQRVHERVAGAYEGMLEMFDWVMEIVNATYPMVGPGPEPPPEPDSKTLRPIQARIAAYASPEVKAMIYERWIPMRNEFFDQASNLAAMTKQQERGGDVKADWGIGVGGQYMRLHSLREEMHSIVREIENRVNDELRQ